MIEMSHLVTEDAIAFMTIEICADCVELVRLDSGLSSLIRNFVSILGSKCSLSFFTKILESINENC